MLRMDITTVENCRRGIAFDAVFFPARKQQKETKSNTHAQPVQACFDKQHGWITRFTKGLLKIYHLPMAYKEEVLLTQVKLIKHSFTILGSLCH